MARMETDTANAMGLYRNAGPEGNPADTGLGMGRMLYDAELAARTRYQDPVVPQQGPTQVTGRDDRTNPTPEYYNYQPALPVKYSVPSAAKERMVAREAIRQAAGENLPSDGTVIRTDPITDDEINYLQSMKDQVELADFDRYVNSLIDPRKPGNLKWLMEIYPEFVNRRISQVHTDYEYALRNQMIDSWGINTFDDLHFKYLVDQGKIDGPYLTPNYDPTGGYEAGFLSPYKFVSKRGNGVRLPFASAQVGANAGGPGNWVMRDDNMPLAKNRGLGQMALSMYQDGDSIGEPGGLTFGAARNLFGTGMAKGGGDFPRV
jgi:hypothetical protein